MNRTRVSNTTELRSDLGLKKGNVVYWMSRDQRVEDNWALLEAQKRAMQYKGSVIVVFCLQKSFKNANQAQFKFMLEGLRQVEESLRKLNISFHVLYGQPSEVFSGFLAQHNVSQVVTDFSPLRESRKWKGKLAKSIKIPLVEVDAHNIIPCWEASEKKEYAAWTFRKKVNKKLGNYLVEFPKLKKQDRSALQNFEKVDWDRVYKFVKPSKHTYKKVKFKPGEAQAKKILSEFISKKLKHYADQRNDPNADAESNLSPYLHFGQISAQRVALEISRIKKYKESREAFLEELIVRRELADNFCYYEPKYDNFEGFPDWAKKTLQARQSDPRQYNYSLKELEQAQTHDKAWNCSQKELLFYGKIHGYMRMYWAKKILEWSPSPEQALKIAIYLNDKYGFDGRDPNGYAGISWSIGGVHDRPWPEREIFGMVRYMTSSGLRRKFDTNLYVNKLKSSEF
jgi:deoxyribodipyrimidine photo-lyase